MRRVNDSLQQAHVEQRKSCAELKLNFPIPGQSEVPLLINDYERHHTVAHCQRIHTEFLNSEFEESQTK